MREHPDCESGQLFGLAFASALPCDSTETAILPLTIFIFLSRFRVFRSLR